MSESVASDASQFAIFISYRRDDTKRQANRLYDDLCRSFSREHIFMDTRGESLPWGEDWDHKLHAALQNCHALVAVVGPKWTTLERTPGCRRLDVADDWVRREIATALHRHIPVFTVLFDAHAPQPADLPPDLQALRFDKFTAHEISQEEHWLEGVEQLVAGLVRTPALKRIHQFVTAKTGIGLLQELIRTKPHIGNTVRDSRGLLENLDREVTELGALKDIHDALQEIESKCLTPLCGARERPEEWPAALVRAHRRFIAGDREIRSTLAEVPSIQKLSMLSELPTLLPVALQALERAASTKGERDYQQAVTELEELIMTFLMPLDTLIDQTTTRLQLEQLQDLMRSVSELLLQESPAAATDHELKPLFDATQALQSLRSELAQRVREHGLLQRLDSLLHASLRGLKPGTSDRIEMTALVSNWNHIRIIRQRFTPPYSPEVQDAVAIFEELEPEIEVAIARADALAATNRLNGYFNEVSQVFRTVDRNLKDFCSKLRLASSPLKTILDMCKVEGRHV